MDQAELIALVETAPARSQAARVDALRKNPGKRSYDEGAASPVIKLEAATAKANERLARVVGDLHAARELLAEWDETDAAEIRKAEALMDRTRAAAEAAIVEMRKAEGLAMPAAAPAGAVTAIRRDDPAWRNSLSVRPGA